MATATVTTVPAVNSHVVHVPAVAQPQTDHPAKRFKNVFMIIGVTMVSGGVLSFILGGVGLSPSFGAYAGSGMWGGAWYIASGGLAIATGVQANNCNVIAGLVVSILTSLVAFGVGIAESVMAGSCGISYYYSCQGGYAGIHGTIAALAFIACILAIIHSSFCCCGSTCCQGSQYQGSVVTTVTTMQPAQVPVQQQYVMAQPLNQAYYPQAQATVVPVQAQPTAMTAQPAQMQPGAAYPPPYAHTAEKHTQGTS